MTHVNETQPAAAPVPASGELLERELALVVGGGDATGGHGGNANAELSAEDLAHVVGGGAGVSGQINGSSD
jgi:hypothetical protein